MDKRDEFALQYIDRSTTSPVLNSKVHIPHGEEGQIAYRSRLNTSIQIGKSKKLTLISASAGFGKTTLISDWIERQNVAAGWILLDQGDNDLTRFWQYMIVAIKSINPAFGEQIHSFQVSEPHMV